MRTRKLTNLAGAGAAALALAGIGAAAAHHQRLQAHTTHPKSGAAIMVPGQDGDATLLFNGWRIRPAGRALSTGDMLLGGAISPDGSLLAIANAGFGPHALHLVNVKSEKEIVRFDLPHAWNGLAWSADGARLFVGAGISHSDGDIWTFDRSANGDWTQGKTLEIAGLDPQRTCIAGLALSPDGATLYALNTGDGKLYCLNPADGAVRSSLLVGDHPNACRLAPDGSRLYVTDWGGARVVAVTVTDPSAPKVAATYATGAHPNDIALGKDGRLFVSCGNADAVSVYDTRSGKWQENLRTAPSPASLPGSTPNALALAPDGNTLYAANADNNAVCVLDISRPGQGKGRGFIPTGWYPTAVLVAPDGKLIVGSGKGAGSHPNPGPDQTARKSPGGFKYIGSQLGGLLSFVDPPNEAALAAYTAQVASNTPHAPASAVNTLPKGIRYVLYIIKENRTYDQVFGDLPQGNGDPTLTLFGRDITPNHHALAEEFVLLDNLYCNGEVSADGHPWCDSAYCTDFTQRNWVLSYSGKGKIPESDSVSDPRSGYLWDACNRKGLTYRSYGEYVHASSPREAPEQRVAGARGLLGHGSPRWVGIGRAPGSGPMRDTEKADVFLDEFRAYEASHTIPRFMVMSLGEDHTRGTVPGAFTPRAAVASNDQALGKIVDTISHSSVWDKFAIFVIEDDAQNGPDHVDSHRTMGLVISPYTRRHFVDSTMYSTTSFVRTMELMLGLSPLTQYDASATPLFASFTAALNRTPYTLLPPRTDLAAINPRLGVGAKESARLDFSDYDRADPTVLNRVLWQSIKGPNVPMPSPTYRSGVAFHAARTAPDEK